MTKPVRAPVTGSKNFHQQVGKPGPSILGSKNPGGTTATAAEQQRKQKLEQLYPSARRKP